VTGCKAVKISEGERERGHTYTVIARGRTGVFASVRESQLQKVTSDDSKKKGKGRGGLQNWNAKKALGKESIRARFGRNQERVQKREKDGNQKLTTYKILGLLEGSMKGTLKSRKTRVGKHFDHERQGCDGRKECRKVIFVLRRL